jgi:hypothetical protein
MASITTRETSAGVGDRTGITNANSPLTNAQIDQNFIELNNDKMEESDAVSTNTANKVVKRDANGDFAMGDLTAVDITASSLTISGGSGLPESSGGTGETTYSNGQLLIGNSSNGLTKATLTGTSNRVTVTNGSGSITLSTPQDIATSSNVQFSSIGIGTSASGTSGQIRATNTITSYYSDERLKTDIALIENPLEKVESLRGVTFRANDIAESFGYNSEQEQVGVIAQDIQKVLPQIVVPAPFDRMIYEGTEMSRSGQDYMTVQYEKIVPLLIEAIKELNKQVKELTGANNG